MANARFDDKVTLRIDLADEFLAYSIPTYLLQPIVENSIKHGFGDGGLEIGISAYKKGSDIVLKIRDNGVGMSKIALYNLFGNKPINGNEFSGYEDAGLGLKNVRMRMKLYYNRDIEIHSEKGKGTEIIFTLPLEQEMITNYKGNLNVDSNFN